MTAFAPGHAEQIVIERDDAILADQAFAAAVVVREHCPDADLILQMLGLAPTIHHVKRRSHDRHHR